jgi:hypothetical protein
MLVAANLLRSPSVSVPSTTPWIFDAMFIQFFFHVIWLSSTFLGIYSKLSVIYHYYFYASPWYDVQWNWGLNFWSWGINSIHWWTKFLYIIGAYFYILLEQLSVHFYTLIHYSIVLLCIVRTLWHKLLEQLSVYFYTILYIVGTQFYALFYVLFGSGPSRFRYNNLSKARVFCVLCTIPLLIICP